MPSTLLMIFVTYEPILTLCPLSGKIDGETREMYGELAKQAKGALTEVTMLRSTGQPRISNYPWDFAHMHIR